MVGFLEFFIIDELLEHSKRKVWLNLRHHVPGPLDSHQLEVVDIIVNNIASPYILPTIIHRAAIRHKDASLWVRRCT